MIIPTGCDNYFSTNIQQYILLRIINNMDVAACVNIALFNEERNFIDHARRRNTLL